MVIWIGESGPEFFANGGTVKDEDGPELLMPLREPTFSTTSCAVTRTTVTTNVPDWRAIAEELADHLEGLCAEIEFGMTGDAPCGGCREALAKFKRAAS